MFANHRNLLMLVLIGLLGTACVPAGEGVTGRPATTTFDPTGEGVTSRPTRTPFVPFAPVSKEELEGTKWLLVSYGPEEARREVLPSSEAYITFNNTIDMSGFAGCNNFGTHYDIEEERLITDGIDRTRFDCPDESLREQDEAILAALAMVETIGLEGDTLMLGHENAVLRFVKEPPPPITPLTGSAWQFDGFMIGDDLRPVLTGSVITAEMADGAIRGTSGCNAYGADYEVDGELLSVGELTGTAMLCLDDAVMEQENAFVLALGGARSFLLDEHTLSINYGSGRLIFSNPATATEPFTGTLWRLADLTWGGERVTLPEQPGITAQFDPREVVGSTGCNEYRSPYTTGGTTVTFGYVQATEEGCPDEQAAAIERVFMTALEQSAFVARVTEDELTLANVDATLVFSSAEPAATTSSGVPAVDEAISTLLGNDLDARRELVRFTTAGCTTVMGLGGPPKCEEGQPEGSPVEYFPLLGPGEGATVMPEAIDEILDVQLQGLYAAFRRSDDLRADPFFPAGTFGVIFESGRDESVPCFVVRLDEDGRIVRLDYLMFSALDMIEREAAEVLVPAGGERCERMSG